MSSIHFRQDHLIHRLRLQSGQAQRVRVGQAGAGLRWAGLSEQVRSDYQEKHRTLQSKTPL